MGLSGVVWVANTARGRLLGGPLCSKLQLRDLLSRPAVMEARSIT